MKNIIRAVAVCIMMSLLLTAVSCTKAGLTEEITGERESETTIDLSGVPETIDMADETLPPEYSTAKVDADSEEIAQMSGIAEKILDATDFSGVNYMYPGDKYSSDTLIYVYGLTEEDIALLDNFIITEQTEQGANTLCVFVFKDGTSDSAIENIKNELQSVYVESLKASLEAYNPDAYVLCDKAVFQKNGNSLLFMICEDSDVEIIKTAVEEEIDK